MTQREIELFEELLNRVLDASDGDASGGLYMIKKQAERIQEFRDSLTPSKPTGRPQPVLPQPEDDIPF